MTFATGPPLTLYTDFGVFKLYVAAYSNTLADQGFCFVSLAKNSNNAHSIETSRVTCALSTTATTTIQTIDNSGADPLFSTDALPKCYFTQELESIEVEKTHTSFVNFGAAASLVQEYTIERPGALGILPGGALRAKVALLGEAVTFQML